MLDAQIIEVAVPVLDLLAARMKSGQRRSTIGGLADEINEVRSLVHARFPGRLPMVNFPEAKPWWPVYETYFAVGELLDAAQNDYLYDARRMIEGAYRADR